MPRLSHGRIGAAALVILSLAAIGSPSAWAQTTMGSRNVTLHAHLPLGGGSHGSLVLDSQRPLVYIARSGESSGVDIVVIDDPAAPRVASSWRAGLAQDVTDLAILHDGDTPHLAVGTDQGLYLLTVSAEGEVETDTPVTGDPVHAMFAYHAGDGDRLLFVATRDVVEIRNMADIAEVVGTLELPEDVRGPERRFRGLYAQYDLETDTDRLYTARTGGYGVVDVTDPASPTPITSVSSAAVQVGVGVQAFPDGSHLVTTANYPTAPIRLFDLRPALSGEISQTRVAVGAWTDNWRRHAERFEVRWPYLFVASGTEGLRMVNLRNPFEPFTTAYFHTYDGPVTADGPRGAVDVAVRDADGLVAVSDETTGLWLLAIEDFTHWDGRGWGVPNLSSTQRWDTLPSLSDRWN
ncbi:MAG: hypothetical protein AAF170_14890 [Bacteroidota bacterium]